MEPLDFFGRSFLVSALTELAKRYFKSDGWQVLAMALFLSLLVEYPARIFAAPAVTPEVIYWALLNSLSIFAGSVGAFEVAKKPLEKLKEFLSDVQSD